MNRTVGLQAMFLLAIAVWLVALPSQAAVHWTKLARHVGQNEKAHAAAIRELRKIKDLDQVLLKALETSERFHALDVIAALKLNSMVPQLLERVSADEDGFLVLTLNSLLSAENKTLILDTYVEKLKPDRHVMHSAAAIVAMLEPLDRAGISLSKETVVSLLEHPFPEVRSSALSYVRAMVLHHRRKDFAGLVLKALQSSPYQLRLQSLALIEEVAKYSALKSSIDFNNVAAICEKEKNVLVKGRCSEITKANGGAE